MSELLVTNKSVKGEMKLPLSTKIITTNKIGLRYDDLISEESELVQEALRRFEIAEPRSAYDRAFRIRVAQQCSLSHQLLSKDKWVTDAQVNNSKLEVSDKFSLFTHNSL
jgi:ubiquinol-cytochrome c reductase subunit 7